VKTADEIHDRIRFLITRELDRRVEEATQRLPHLCRHNKQHSIDARKQVDGERNYQYNRIDTKNPQLMGLCMYGAENPEEWPGDICEDEIDAKRCPWFEPLRSKKALIEHFQIQLQTGMWMEDNMPEVAQLLWVLGDGDRAYRGIPWWKHLWYRFLRIRVEPVIKVESPLALLQEAVEDDDDASDSS
jgi:hypothetical protein